MRPFPWVALAISAALCASIAPSVLAASDPFCVTRVGCFPRFAEALAALRDGGELVITPGRHLKAVGVLTANRVTLRSRGPERATLVADEAHAEGKAILVIRGTQTRIENLGFEGARVPDGNGAGIRLEAPHLSLDRCLFDGNEMGLLTGRVPSSIIQITNSEFRQSRRSKGPAHNIYVGHAAKLEMRGVWSHGAHIGHALKSRARFNDIQGNFFSGRGGNTSYEVEFPIGGYVLFAGNIVEQIAPNDNDTLLSYGAEFKVEVNPPPHELVIGQNTFINHSPSGRLLRLHAMPNEDQPPRLTLSANTWVGAGLQHEQNRENAALPQSALEAYWNCHPYRPAVPSTARPYARFEYRHPASYVARNDLAMGAHASAMSLCEK